MPTKFIFTNQQFAYLRSESLNMLTKCIVALLVMLCMHSTYAQDKPRPGEQAYGDPPRNTCQWGERGDGVLRCTGMVGLLRLSKDSINGLPEVHEKARQILFGTKDLPAIGSEVTLKRSAHLRTKYWPERDDQEIRENENTCHQIACSGNWHAHGSCGVSVGEYSFLSQFTKDKMKESRKKPILCPGPTDGTEYLAAGTVVKVIGYQQLGQFFVLVQVVKIESIYPLDDEKKYEFDHREII